MTMMLDGGRLETAWWGPGPEAAPTLVLLHEGLGSVALWRDVPERLAELTGCGVFAYSRFGYGQSDGAPLPWPVDYMHREALMVLPRVLGGAGVRRMLLVGHSDGGSIATIYAGGVHDDRLAGVALIAAHFFVETLNIASIARIRDDYQSGGLRERLAKYHRDVDNAFWGWNGAWLNPAFREFDLSDYIERIQVPILALQGADDPYGSDEQLRVLQRLARTPVDARLIPEAKHSPHLEAKPATLAAIARFAADCLPELAA